MPKPPTPAPGAPSTAALAPTPLNLSVGDALLRLVELSLMREARLAAEKGNTANIGETQGEEKKP